MGNETRRTTISLTDDRKPFAPLEDGDTIYDVLLDKYTSATTEKEAKEATEQLRQAGILEPDPHKGLFVAMGHAHNRAWAEFMHMEDYLQQHLEIRMNPDSDSMTAAGDFIGSNLPLTEIFTVIGIAMLVIRRRMKKRRK